MLGGTRAIEKLLIVGALLIVGSASAQAQLGPQSRPAEETLNAVSASSNGSNDYGPFSDAYGDESKLVASPFRPLPGPITTDTGKLTCICDVRSAEQ